MSATGQAPSDPPATSDPPESAAVAAAEAEIAETRRKLDAAIAALRHDLALPIAAVLATAALLDEAGEGAQLRDFVRRNALPIGLIGLGAAWLAVQNRAILGTLGGSYAREFLERARVLGKSAAEAALSAALEEIGGPPGEPPEGGSEPPPVARAVREPDQDQM
jgi:hypothetical protein